MARVVPGLDERPRRLGERDRVDVAGRDAADRRPQRRGVSRRAQLPRLAVDDDLGDSRDPGRDARHARCHRLEQHGRKAVGVAVGADDARGDEQVGIAQQVRHIALREGAGHAHDPFEAERAHPIAQLARELAVSRQRQLGLDALPAQLGEGIEQHAEALLLDEPADRGHAQRARDALGSAVSESVDLDRVGHQADLLGVHRCDHPQVRHVEGADGRDVGGIGDERAQAHRIDGLVEQVLRVRSERVRDAGDHAREPRDDGRGGREVRVEVGEALLARPLGERDGGHGLVGLRRQQIGQRASDPLAHPGLGLAQRGPEKRRLRRPRQVGDGSGDARELRVEPRILRGAQREHREGLAGRLASEQLGDDERLGEARVHLHDVSDAAARIVRLQCSPLPSMTSRRPCEIGRERRNASEAVERDAGAARSRPRRASANQRPIVAGSMYHGDSVSTRPARVSAAARIACSARRRRRGATRAGVVVDITSQIVLYPPMHTTASAPRISGRASGTRRTTLVRSIAAAVPPVRDRRPSSGVRSP